MRKRGLWGYSRLVALAVLVAIASAPAAFAVTSNSKSYQVTETEFGASSNKQACSDQYCATTSIGSLASGDSTGASNNASFGPITPNEPSLDVIVLPGVSDLGNLTTERTATKTTSLKIRSYLSGGYTVQIVGEPPKIKGHTLSAITTDGVASQMGTEQFGINLAANTSPSVGSDPVQVPDAQTSFGQVSDAYKVPNRFKYVSGATVAFSTRSSGQTDYTISTIVNVSNKTPAGHYSGDFSAVVIPVY